MAIMIATFQRVLKLLMQGQPDPKGLPLVGKVGRFKSARNRWHKCLVTDAFTTTCGREFLLINYETTDGDEIEGAQIPLDAFRE